MRIVTHLASRLCGFNLPVAAKGQDLTTREKHSQLTSAG